MAKLTEEQKQKLKEVLAESFNTVELDATEAMLENYLQIKYLIQIHEDLQQIVTLLKREEPRPYSYANTTN